MFKCLSFKTMKVLFRRNKAPNSSSVSWQVYKCQLTYIYLRYESLELSPVSSSPTAAAAKLHQSCPTLCDPTDGSPPGSSVPGILQARILEWVAISFSTSSPDPPLTDFSFNLIVLPGSSTGEKSTCN